MASRAIVLYAIVLHGVLWAPVLLIYPEAGSGTTLSTLIRLFGSATPLVLWGAALLAIAGLVRPHWRVLPYLPQQALLLLASGAVVQAVAAGQFADGVPRSWAFIFADQGHMLLTTAFHTWAIIRVARGE